MVFTIFRLGTGAVVARMLGPAGMGTWALLDLLTNYSRVFGGPRFEIASVHFLGRKDLVRGEVMCLTNLMALASSALLIVLFAVAWDPLQAAFLRKTAIHPLMIAAVIAHLPLLFVGRNCMYFLLSREDIRTYNRLFVLQDLSKAVITLTLLLVFRWGLWSLVVGLLASSVLAVGYGIRQMRTHEPMVWRVNWSLCRQMARFSSRVYLSEAIGFLNIYLANLLTAWFLSPSALAFFSMGKGKSEWLNRITNATSAVLYPRVANQTGLQQDARQVTTTTFRLSLLVLVVAGTGLAFAIYPAALILYGREFLPLVTVFWLVLPGVIVQSAAANLRQYFLGIGRAEIPMRISIVPLLLQALFCYWWIPLYGYLGAAAAVCATLGLAGVITVIVYHQMSKEKYREMLLPTVGDLQAIARVVKAQWQGMFARVRPRAQPESVAH